MVPSAHMEVLALERCTDNSPRREGKLHRNRCRWAVQAVGKANGNSPWLCLFSYWSGIETQQQRARRWRSGELEVPGEKRKDEIAVWEMRWMEALWNCSAVAGVVLWSYFIPAVSNGKWKPATGVCKCGRKQNGMKPELEFWQGSTTEGTGEEGEERRKEGEKKDYDCVF